MPLYDTRINVWITSDMADDLDDWRRAQPNPPTRPEVMRTLTEAGLLVFKPETIRALESWAARQPDNPHWSEAARRLLLNALKDEAGD